MKKVLISLFIITALCGCSNSTTDKTVVCKTPDNYSGDDMHQKQFELIYDIDKNTNELKSFTIINNISDEIQTYWESIDASYNREASYEQAIQMSEELNEEYKKYDFVDYKIELDENTKSYKTTAKIDLTANFDYMAEENENLANTTGYIYFYDQEKGKFIYQEDIVKYLYSAVTSLSCN